MRFSPLLFDLDGTLVDSSADLATAVNRLRAERELPALPDDDVRQAVGDGASMLLRRTFPVELCTPELLARFLVLYGERIAEATRPYPGIVELLVALQGRPLAVVTNKPLLLAVQLLDALALSRYFAVVIGGDSAPVKKPHPLPLQLALHRLQAEAGNALMIGDHHTDLHSGRAAGVATCFCAWGFGQCGDAISDYRADSVAELAALIL